MRGVKVQRNIWLQTTELFRLVLIRFAWKQMSVTSPYHLHLWFQRLLRCKEQSHFIESNRSEGKEGNFHLLTFKVWQQTEDRRKSGEKLPSFSIARQSHFPSKCVMSVCDFLLIRQLKWFNTISTSVVIKHTLFHFYRMDSNKLYCKMPHARVITCLITKKNGSALIKTLVATDTNSC